MVTRSPIAGNKGLAFAAQGVVEADHGPPVTAGARKRGQVAEYLPGQFLSQGVAQDLRLALHSEHPELVLYAGVVHFALAVFDQPRRAEPERIAHAVADFRDRWQIVCGNRHKALFTLVVQQTQDCNVLPGLTVHRDPGQAQLLVQGAPERRRAVGALQPDAAGQRRELKRPLKLKAAGREHERQRARRGNTVWQGSPHEGQTTKFTTRPGTYTSRRIGISARWAATRSLPRAAARTSSRSAPAATRMLARSLPLI